VKTDQIPALVPGLALEESFLANGTKRFLNQNDLFCIEIIPDKSVSFFLNVISDDVLVIIDSYSGSRELTVAALNRAQNAIANNPNTKFQEHLGDDVFLVYTMIAPADGWTLYLAICEE
jgi:hypothetical protein